MAKVNAWKSDSEGPFIEMDLGEKKDYSLDWTDYPGLVTLSNVVWTINANLQKITQAEVGKVTQVLLFANGLKGVWPCSLEFTDVSGVPKEIFHFRVVVR